MNKFEFNRNIFNGSIVFSAIILVLTFITSSLTSTPEHISFFTASVIALVILIYLSFFEKDKKILKKWHAKIALLFIILSIGAVLALGDNTLKTIT